MAENLTYNPKVPVFCDSNQLIKWTKYEGWVSNMAIHSQCDTKPNKYHRKYPHLCLCWDMKQLMAAIVQAKRLKQTDRLDS